jgi:DNA primase
MLFSTTTAIDIDEELMNRCLVLSVDESRTQTKAIHQAQRNKRTLAGLRAKQGKQQLIQLHQNAQRLLRPLAVLNPYADKLTFLDDKTRTRRDHEKYLTLIDSIALLHQYQRPIKKDKHGGIITEYIEVTREDIKSANQLAHEVLGKTLDELPPQTRRLLQLIYEMVTQHGEQHDVRQCDYRFSRKTIRDYSGFSDFQVKKHLSRLEDLEYVLIHKGKRGQSYEYELLYQGEGDEASRFLMGLIDVEKLQYDENKEPQNKKNEPSSSPQSAPKLPLSCMDENAKNLEKNSLNSRLSIKAVENALLDEINNRHASHHNATHPILPLAAKA